MRRPEPEGPQGRRGPADRPPFGSRTRDPGPVPPAQEQPAAGGRPRRGQDRDCRGPRQEDRRRRDAGYPGGLDHLLPRHGRAPGRHAVSRRFRRAAESRGQGTRGSRGRRPLHRRDPHGDRRGRDVGRGDGCLEPAETRAAGRQAALHGLHHLQGVPPALREGPRAQPPVPEDRRERADGRGFGEDPDGAETLFREAPRPALHQ